MNLSKLIIHKSAITNHLLDSDFACSPKWILDMFDGYYDPCPQQPTVNGLSVFWGCRNYCNPPYSEKELWIQKAIQEQQNNKLTVMLLPNATDIVWFSNLVVPNAEIFF